MHLLLIGSFINLYKQGAPELYPAQAKSAYFLIIKAFPQLKAYLSVFMYMQLDPGKLIVPRRYAVRY